MKIVTRKILQDLITEAEQSPRKRANFNFHSDSFDTSRFLNVGGTNTYWVPHYHADKWEHVTILVGKLGIVKFDNLGNITDKVVLERDNVPVVEIEPREYHTFVALTDPVVVDESKKGPYIPISDKVLAMWAPVESSAEGKAYLKQLRKYFDGP